MRRNRLESMINSTTDISGAVQNIEGFWREMGKSLPVILRKVARIEAVSLARSTQPTSTADGNTKTSGNDVIYVGAKDRKMGEDKIERDIRKVYGSGGDVYLDIRAFSKSGDNRQLADAFYYFFKASQIKGSRGAQALLDASGSQFAGQDIGQKLDPSFHRNSRNGRGRVPGQRSRSKLQQIPKTGEIEKYVEKVQKKVGLAKGGWADAARAVGLSTRGIPQWVTRHKGGGTGKDQTKLTRNPSITLHNTVPYVSDLLSAADIAMALKIARDRLTLEMTAAKAAIAAKRNRAA